MSHDHDHDHDHGHDHGHGSHDAPLPTDDTDHDHSHDHGLIHHHDVSHVSDGRLIGSIVLNVGLTVVEVVVGVAAGSLALVADAVHNLNDAAALFIALAARRVARRGADQRYTFGYRRAELIGAMINLTALGLVGLYLLVEAVDRLIHPTEVLAGWVAIAAGVAFVVDVFTALFLWDLSRGSLNVRAAFIHNLTDAGASIAVLLGAGAIWLFNWTFIDPLLTLVIAIYILWMSVVMLKRTIHILMEGTPPDLDLDLVMESMTTIAGVNNVHHVHAWELDEHHRALEAHVLLAPNTDGEALEQVRRALRAHLRAEYRIEHATLEFEWPETLCCDDDLEAEARRCHQNGSREQEVTPSFTPPLN